MRAVVAREPGGPDVLETREVAEPDAGPGEVVIDVAATAVNRADILGLECSGTVSAVGAGVERWRVGDRVCALLSSGGYADKVAAPSGQLLPVPSTMDCVMPPPCRRSSAPCGR